jgi:hypothetical protein
LGAPDVYGRISAPELRVLRDSLLKWLIVREVVDPEGERLLATLDQRRCCDRS